MNKKPSPLCRIVFKAADAGMLNFVNDETIIKLKYRLKTGKKLDLDNPQTYNEKLQWLKLHDRKPIYTTMVDKYEVKKYVADIIGKEHIIPTIGIYDKFDDINFDKLPNKFVIKCTHDSGGLVICNNKAKLNLKSTRKTINNCLRKNFYWAGREWPYKNVKPRILIEQYMEDPKEKDLKDYKFFCFDGKIGIVLVCTNRPVELEETWLDENFNVIDLREGGHRNRTDLRKPAKFDQMKRVATKLSKNVPHVRVDLYEIKGQVYFGELTFFPAGGLEQFDDESWNDKLGKLINNIPIEREKK